MKRQAPTFARQYGAEPGFGERLDPPSPLGVAPIAGGVESWGREALLSDTIWRAALRALGTPVPGGTGDEAKAARRHPPAPGVGTQDRVVPIDRPRRRRTRAARGRLRVLIADDERLLAEAIKAVLARDDRIEVVGCAVNGEQALALTESLTPDVVLMDLNMPVMDGAEATRRIRKRTEARVVVLTGSDDTAALARARRAGASDLLPKTTDPDDLIDRLVAVAPSPAAV